VFFIYLKTLYTASTLLYETYNYIS